MGGKQPFHGRTSQWRFQRPASQLLWGSRGLTPATLWEDRGAQRDCCFTISHLRISAPRPAGQLGGQGCLPVQGAWLWSSFHMVASVHCLALRAEQDSLAS